MVRNVAIAVAIGRNVVVVKIAGVSDNVAGVNVVTVTVVAVADDDDYY